MESTLCPHCGEDQRLELEVWDHEFMPLPCCEAAQAEWAEAPQRELFQYLTAGSMPIRAVTEGLLDFYLETRVVTGSEAWQLARDRILRHHRHNAPPVGWYFGVECYNGPTLVGLAVVGRPVARGYNGCSIVEVTRNCTWGCRGLERHAASKLYGHAAREAKARGYEKIITYTYAEEAAVSVRAAGWTEEAFVRGRSWSCKSRPRTARVNESKDKRRWAKVLQGPK
jgi:hypothetical protein